nr:MAG TPA: hypothetical protein [Caudoviricetes sp.]
MNTRVGRFLFIVHFTDFTKSTTFLQVFFYCIVRIFALIFFIFLVAFILELIWNSQSKKQAD